MSTVNVDGDWALFRGCFSCEKSVYTLIRDGNVPIKFESKAELNKYVDQEGLKEYEIRKEADLQPFEYAAGTIKSMLNLVKERLNADTLNIYLTGNGNFRYKVAKTAPYKGNRIKSQRPHWYEEAKEYMVKYWNAQVVDGMEADDALGINQTDASILVSPDKDLDQIPGWHYNPVKENKYNVDEFTAYYNFCVQMLVGDASDNIKGLDGIGPVRAASILDGITGKESLRLQVLDAYLDAYKTEQGLERYKENYKLLHILRDKRELESIND